VFPTNGRGASVDTVLDELLCNGAEIDNDLASLDSMDLFLNVGQSFFSEGERERS
jgi:hypothetical protein